MNVGCCEYPDVKVDRLQLVIPKHTKNPNKNHFFMVSLGLNRGNIEGTNFQLF